MAMPGLTAIVSALLLQTILGASIYSDKKEAVEGLVRREKSAVELTPAAHVTEHGKHKHKHKHHHSHHAFGVTDISFCDFDFPLGTPEQSTCLMPLGDARLTADARLRPHTLITSRLKCREAAKQAGACEGDCDKQGKPGLENFNIELQKAQRYEHKHAKGCFMKPCMNGAKKCYYFNGIGNWPQGKDTQPDPTTGVYPDATDGTKAVYGTPVCQRPKYLLGSPNKHPSATGGGPDDGCPTGYKAIVGQQNCRYTANCLGDAAGASFQVGDHNATKHKDFPRYCFKDDTGILGGGNNKVYFNNWAHYNKAGKLDMAAMTTKWTGTAVKGTPICKVAETVRFNGATNVAGDVDHNVNDNATAATDSHGVITPTPAPAAGG